MSSVLVVGSVALDSVETPFGRKEEMLGGSATYFSLAASHFVPVRMVAVVGKDFPEEGRQLLASRNIDLEGLQIVDGRTFRWSGEYTDNMNEAITRDTQLNVFEDFKPLLPGDYARTDWVFLGNIDPELQWNVLLQMHQPEWVALDTMNFWIENSGSKVLAVLKKIDMLIINEGELRLLTGTTGLRRGVDTLMAMGPRSIVIKRGEYGSVLYHGGEWFFVPGFPESRIVDPTGAGDSFAGGLMGSLARDGQITAETLRRAMVNGSVMASYTITGFGPWVLAGLAQEQLQQRFDDFVKIASIRI